MDGLDLSGFHIDKKRVKVTLGNVRETGELVTVRASNITATIKGLRWSYRQQYFPYANGVGVADADIKGGDITLGFRLVRHRPKEGGARRTPISSRSYRDDMEFLQKSFQPFARSRRFCEEVLW